MAHLPAVCFGNNLACHPLEGSVVIKVFLLQLSICLMLIFIKATVVASRNDDSRLLGAN